MATLTIDCRMAWQAGIGRYIRDIVPALVQSGEFSISCVGRREELERLDWYDKIKPIFALSKPFRPLEHVEIPLAVDSTDLYWAPQFCVPWAAPLRTRRLIVTIHDVYHLTDKSAVNPLQRAYMRALLSFAGRAAHRIIAVSNFTHSEILRHTGVPDRKITTILNGIDLDFASGFEPTDLSQRYILCVGNVKPHKNLKNTLIAFKRILPRFPDLHLNVVGMTDGFFTGCENIHEWCRGVEERVHFLGRLSDYELKNRYANALALVFPSFYEGFGYPPLEAMSFGVPVAASNAASVPEICGQAATYFDPANVDDMAEKIGSILASPPSRDRERYRAHLDAFDLQRTRNLYLALFREEARLAGGK